MRMADRLVRDGETGNQRGASGMRWCQGCHTMRPVGEFEGRLTCRRCRERSLRNMRRLRGEREANQEVDGVWMCVGRGMPDLGRRGVLCRRVMGRPGDGPDEVVLEVI